MNGQGAKARKSPENVKVIALIFSSDEKNDRIYRLPPNTLCLEVCAKWCEECSISVKICLFLPDENQPLPDNRTLGDLLPSPGVPISLHAVPEELPVYIQLLGQPPTAQRLIVHSHQQPRDLLEDVYRRFDLASSLKFRLRSERRILEDTLAFWRQEVGPEDVLSVELQYAGVIVDRFSKRIIRQFSLYASDAASALRCPPITRDQRFWYQQTQLNTSGSIAEALQAVLRDTKAIPPSLRLEVEMQWRLRILSENGISSAIDLWPSSRLPSSPSSAVLHFAGRPLVDRSASVVSAAIPCHGLLQSDAAAVPVRRPEGRLAVARVPRVANFGDLSRSLSAGPFEYGATRQRWRENDRLTAADAFGGDVVTVGKASVTFTVEISVNNRRKFTLQQQRAKISSILRCLLRGGVALTSLEARTIGFACFGCTRKIWREEEEFQEIPTPCCREKSLLLKIVHRKKEMECMTPWAFGHMSRRRQRNVAVETERKQQHERYSQTRLCLVDAGTQTSPTGEASPTRILRRSTSQNFDEELQSQRQPELKEFRSLPTPTDKDNQEVEFYVCNWARLGQPARDVRCTLRLPESPNVSDVVEALAQELGISTSTFLLKQWRAVSKETGQDLVWVCRQTGHPGDEYGTVDGHVLRRRDVDDDRSVELTNRQEAFPLVKGRRNIVILFQR